LDYAQRWPVGLVRAGPRAPTLRITRRGFRSRVRHGAGSAWSEVGCDGGFSALVSGLDAEWGRLYTQDRPGRIDVLCAALDLRPRPYQAQPANAAHNPALFIRFGGLARAREPVHALRVRSVAGSGVPG